MRNYSRKTRKKISRFRTPSSFTVRKSLKQKIRTFLASSH